MEIFNEYVVAVVMMICLLVGYIIKHLVDSAKVNRFIPLIMALLGVIINMWINEFAITPEILLGGMASGLASTGMHQAFKQFLNGKGGEQ